MKKLKLGSVKAVIFDMDGVITDTMYYHFLAWKKVFAEKRIRVGCFDIYKREGQDGLTSIKEIFNERHLKISEEEAKILLAKKEKIFRQIVKRKFIPGSRSFIHFLNSKGFLLGLVTGTSYKEMKKILPHSLINLFGAIVTGDDVKRGKPHPEPFLKALEKLKLKPKEAIVIENAPFGIRAAKKAGIFCIALETSLPKNFLKEANRIVKSFFELKRYFIQYKG